MIYIIYNLITIIYAGGIMHNRTINPLNHCIATTEENQPQVLKLGTGYENYYKMVTQDL